MSIGTKKRGRPKSSLTNHIKEIMHSVWTSRDEGSSWPLWMDDVVSGIARLDWYGDREGQRPLSTVSILKIFMTIDTITVDEIAQLLHVEKSQASLYMKACQLAYPFLKRSIDRNVNPIYPATTIVSVEHGIACGYDKQSRALI